MVSLQARHSRSARGRELGRLSMRPFQAAHAPRARPITSWCGRGRRRTKRRSDGTANKPSSRWSVSPLPSKTASSVRGQTSALPNGAPAGWHPSSESHPLLARTDPDRARGEAFGGRRGDGSAPRTSRASIDSCGSADVLPPRARSTCGFGRMPSGRCLLPLCRFEPRTGTATCAEADPNARRPRISRTTNFRVSLLA